jgi:hypothetical protein
MVEIKRSDLILEEAALLARPSRRMAAGTTSLVAVLRDARILQEAQEHAAQDEAQECKPM